MRKRRDKGLAVIVLIIIVCLILIGGMGGPAILKETLGRKESNLISQNGNKRGETSGPNTMEGLIDNDISVADSFGISAEESQNETMEELTFLMGELSFERSGSQLMMPTVAGLLITYLILIGPFTYFYLKRKGKMEWMWVSLPILSLLFGCVILMMSIDFTITEPYADVLKVITPGKETVCYGASTSPGEEDYSLYFNKSVVSMYPWMNDDHFEVDDERRCITLYPSYAFERDYFQFEMNETERSGFMHNIQIEEGLGIGSVYNMTEYEFSHLLLCYKDNYCILPAVKAGDKVQIEAENWKKDEYGMIGGLKEELQLQAGLTADEERIFNFAWYEHGKINPEELHIAGIFKGGSVGMIEAGVNLISYSLFFQ